MLLRRLRNVFEHASQHVLRVLILLAALRTCAAAFSAFLTFLVIVHGREHPTGWCNVDVG